MMMGDDDDVNESPVKSVLVLVKRSAQSRFTSLKY